VPFSFRNSRWIAYVLAIAGCAFFAARAAGHLLGASLTSSPRAVLAAARELPPAKPETKVFAGRNVFCSTCTPVKAEPAVERPGSLEATRCPLDVRLIATLVSEDDPAWSFAAVLDAPTGQTRLYPIGARLAGRIVVDVSERRVWLHHEGRAEYLDIAADPAGADGAQPRPPAGGVGTASDLGNAVRRLGEGKYEIERGALQRVLSNTMVLASTVRIIPAMLDGKPNGFVVDRIRPGSIVTLLGLQNGDTVHAVNGHAIKSPDDALLVFSQLRRAAASHLTISFSRRGKPSLTYDYTIR
jgi:general secretion pathway protein C